MVRTMPSPSCCCTSKVRPLIRQHLGELGIPVLVYEVFRKDQKADEKLAA